ncbi:MAG: sulfite exporter TauE/SafE family protein [Phycisphaerales bacterium]|nr:sulfite exporter TauE/SafE family protein [Phycisphaerales bacterium]
MQFWDYIILLPLGLMAGASGGLLGIGGSVVMIPAMVILFGPDRQHLYQATAMIVNFFVVAPAVMRHIMLRATLRPVTRWMIPGAIVGAVAGVCLSELPIFVGPGQGYLQIAFAVFLGYVVLQNMWRLRTSAKLPYLSEADSAKLSKPLILTIVGLPTGMLGGLLGVGGGLYAVPAQQVCLRIPLPNAIANSSATILWSSVVGAVLKNASLSSHGHSWSQAILMSICLIPTAMIGSWYSAAKVHQWPVKVIHVAFVLLLLYGGTRLFLVGWDQVS